MCARTSLCLLLLASLCWTQESTLDHPDGDILPELTKEYQESKFRPRWPWQHGGNPGHGGNQGKGHGKLWPFHHNKPQKSEYENADPLQSDCGLNTFTRIVGGKAAKEHKWIWMAALMSPSDKSAPFCGGVLINKNHVLTAAHCTVGQRPSEIIVRLGEYDFRRAAHDGHSDYKVASIREHPQYSQSNQRNDIALLKMEKSVQFGENLQPICLAEPGKTYTGQQATVAGWGTVSFGGRSSPVLQQVTIPVWENRDCSRAYKENFPGSILCAGLKQGGKDSCQGDSGGPLMVEDSSGRWQVIGVVSWGYRCAEPGLPGVYSRVNQYLSFIKNNAG